MEELSQSVEGAPAHCSQCGASLCLRKQVINLSLGNTDSMFCLNCLAKSDRCQPESLISGTVGYIMGRDCFRKEWVRYLNVNYCPEPGSCFPQTCFKSEGSVNEQA